MEIVGLSGFARSGKDEAAKVLVEEYGFTRVGFADKLREVLYALNPWVLGDTLEDGKWKHGQVLLQDVIESYGWDGYKESPFSGEIRRLLQRLGTEAGRQALWDTIWIDAAFAGVPKDAKVVVSDARFFNEFDAVRNRGGEVWRIERPGIGPANDHASELEAVDYPHFSRTIYNSRDLDFLKGLVRECYDAFRSDREVVQPKTVAPPKVGGSQPSVTSLTVPKRKG